MKITFFTYQSVMFVHGGPHVKILALQQALQILGVQVSLFDMWADRDRALDADLFQVFAANLAVYDFARKLHERNVPYVVNPIFYTRRSWPVVAAFSRLDRLTRRFLRGLWWDYGFTRDVCHWALGVWPNTRAEADLLHRGLGVAKEKMRVIPNGVSERFYHADPALFEKSYGMRDFILNVGHVGPDRKNVVRLVQALRQIDHPAVIIGRPIEGGETPAVRRLLESAPNILWIEGLDHNSELLASAYAACRVFVLPSKFETPGRAALEAALAGANIVITPHGGTREYFQDMAEYVDPYSVEAIRRGILKALEKPPIPALRERIRQNYVWERVAQRLLEYYQELLGKAPAPFT